MGLLFTFSALLFFVLHDCVATSLYGLMLEQHAESAWEQQFNMRVDVVARMASSLAASGRTPVEPIMRFAVQNSTWWEEDRKSLDVNEFKDSRVTDDFNKSFLGVVQHSLGEFFDIQYLNSVLLTGFVSHDAWMEQCERQTHSDQTMHLEPQSYCVIDKVLWATRDGDKEQHRCLPGSNVLLTSGLDTKFLARTIVCVDYQRATQEQLQSLLSDTSANAVAFYRWDHLSGSYSEPNHSAFRFNNAMLSGPLHILESMSKCTELDDSGCDSCVVNRGNYFCDVAAYHWRRGDRRTNPNFLPAFSEYLLTMPLQASHFLKAELSKRNISILFLATNSGKMDQVLQLKRLLYPVTVHSSVFESAEWDTAIIRAVTDMVISSLAGFFIMGPGLRGSHLEGVSTYSRRIMLQRIHHLGRTDSSHFTVCCGDLTSISILSPKDGQVFRVSTSSPAVVEVQAVVLNPLKDSQVYVRVENSLGHSSQKIELSMLPSSGRIIQSGRVLDAQEPANMAYLWVASVFVNNLNGRCFLTASTSIFILIFSCKIFRLTFLHSMQVFNAQGDRIEELSVARSEIIFDHVDANHHEL
jgi:hypothetical protein